MTCIKNSASAVALLAMGLSALVGPASAQTRQKPTAVYWITAETNAGMPGMGTLPQGGGFSPLALMGGGGANRVLTLQLQSERRAEGAPAAAHYPPAGLQLGESLPLRTPHTGVANDGSGGGSAGTDMPRGAGRMLIYSGCGETPRKGQPLVIEMSSSGPAALAALSQTAMLQEAAPPSPASGRTYGEWPNENTHRETPSNGSLAGDHVVRGNYTPDIRFSLTTDQDFLEALQLTGLDRSDGAGLGWRPVPQARGYFAYTLGVNEAGDVVMWSSSERPVMAMEIPDLLSPASLDRLLGNKVVLPAATTECPIPAAVTAAAPQSMLHVVAYGSEVNIAYPQRPTDRRQAWSPEYEVKVRYTSTAGRMLGVEMAGVDVADEARDDAAPSTDKNPLDVLPVPGLGQVRAALGLFRRN